MYIAFRKILTHFVIPPRQRRSFQLPPQAIGIPLLSIGLRRRLRL